MIVKVQRPTFSTMREPNWLAYDKDQTHIVELMGMDIPLHVRKALRALTKAYFEADWHELVGCWIFGDEVAMNVEW